MTFRTIPGEGPLRLVVVGAGEMGRTWLRAIVESPLADVVGVVDVNEAAAHAAAPAGAISGTPLSEVARRCAPDAVLDVTAPAAHLTVTLEALELGLPVLGEKPLAATLPEAVKLVRAAEQAGELFMVSQNRRFHPGLWRLKREISALGRVGILTHEFFRAPHFGGFREVMDHPLVLDMAIHNFDAARFLLDADPVAVYCEEYNPPWSWYAGNAATTAVFEMTGGIRFVYTGSWCSPGQETSWNSNWRVSAESGTATWDGAGAPRTEPTDGQLHREHDDEQAGDRGYPGDDLHGSLAMFVRALRGGVVPMGECHDNLQSLAMVHAAIASAESGTRVSVAEVLRTAG
ncbi:Gfo/Idh/MocA family protein [Saccharopolyspora aridisoli]|uniref:Gfo/Idh/MocA family protein n=1 Tax=Saccharopolyspora aridisoli TaxID=2530385 RepID=UPI001A9D55C8|nr:Gfo/Idh/MocA family oxidoreductase [Saccharopolyspora aridisoli]